MAQKVIKSGMSTGWGVFHGVMILFTCGMWYPVYRAHKHSADRTTTVTDVP
jgi:hypothetical protein